MLYINNELTKKDPELLKRFKTIYSDYLDDKGERLIKPVVIKYIPDLIQYQKSVTDERGNVKKQQPASLELSYVAKTTVNSENVEFRYSPVAPTRVKDVLTWNVQKGEVVGQLSTIDIDLVYFFEFFSFQNATNPLNAGSEYAKLMVYNPANEANKKREIEKQKTLINMRLWNEENEGGVKTERIYEFLEQVAGYTPQSVRVQDPDSIRDLVQTYFKTDRLGMTKFISFTNIHVTRRDGMEFSSIEGEARKLELIARVDPKQGYYWKDVEGNTTDLIFSWKDVAGDEKIATKWLQYLKSHPEVVIQLEAAIEAKKNIPATV